MQKNKSIIIVLVMVLVFVFSFTGCNTENNKTNNETDAQVSTENNAVTDDTQNNTSSTVNESAANESTTDQTEEATETTSDSTEETSEETTAPYDDGLPKRDSIPDQYKWDLKKVYVNNNAFMSDVEKVKSSFSYFEKNEKNFDKNYETFSSTLIKYEDIRRTTDTIYVFATLQAHTDTNNTDFSDLEDIAAQLDTDLSEVTAYFLPLIANMDSSTLKTFMANEEMKPYEKFVQDILKEKDHILSVNEEALLAKAQILFEIPESIFDAYNYQTDLSEYLPAPDFNLFWEGTREDKLTVLNDYYTKTKVGNNLLAEIYESEIKKNVFFAESRNYENALESALSNDGLTVEEYNTIFDITHSNLDKLHKWISMKKEILAIEDKIHFYDAYTPLIQNPYSYVEYEEGKDIIYGALAPLGDKYIADLKEGLDSRWADVYTTSGKYEGGYQWGTYDTDPFVLLNFNNYMTDVSTVAHEMGHALNFKYTNEAQEYFASNVPIFSAEIASTTNEALVFEYRIANADSKAEKQRALLNYIELLENTIFTQMIFADFEKRAYEAYESGEPVNAELFNTIMGEVLVEYYGPDYELDDTAAFQWSEIPHFYNSYYVYKYATGLSAGLTFADNILNGSQSDVDKYLVYLASGSSEEPLTLLKKAGVDFYTGEPLQRAFDRFEQLIDEFYETLQ